MKSSFSLSLSKNTYSHGEEDTGYCKIVEVTHPASQGWPPAQKQESTLLCDLTSPGRFP